MKNLIAIFIGVIFLFFLSPTPTFAFDVSPHQVHVSAQQEFSISIVNQKHVAATGLKLLIPSGVTNVIPNTKPGWKITFKRKDGKANGPITEIDWKGGTIPFNQKDVFIFQAQVPSTETTLIWKASQIYADDTIVQWIQDPKPHNATPYATTKIINNANKADTQPIVKEEPSLTDLVSEMHVILFVAAVALLLSIIALRLQLTKKQKD